MIYKRIISGIMLLALVTLPVNAAYVYTDQQDYVYGLPTPAYPYSFFSYDDSSNEFYAYASITSASYYYQFYMYSSLLDGSNSVVATASDQGYASDNIYNEIHFTPNPIAPDTTWSFDTSFEVNLDVHFEPLDEIDLYLDF